MRRRRATRHPEEKKMRKTWFVTGAASHVGAQLVRDALAAGHAVVAADADPAAVLRACASSVATAGERLLVLRLDEVDARAVAEAVRAATQRFGRIDVLVHGAAACSPRSEFAPPGRDLRREFSATVRALFNITRGVLEAMREQRAGRIHHLVPPPGATAGPALFSISGFCEAVAADVAPYGITVSALEPEQLRSLARTRRSPGRDEMLEEA
jgi:NAD(P)-dependent dehydrogenase (short-subunit alcohol dehydrogenase family)